tara:strand:+ start:17011 stop:17481 length:471 start_codon:yes stop_codon:yes gene_type:complete
LAYIDTGKGLFRQTRIGQYGNPFTIYKICSIKPYSQSNSKYGSFLRYSKWDELPQLYNILIGEMSFVGPRPDVPGYYDTLQGEVRLILNLKPGLCSWAALKYYNEETLLAQQENPLLYNDTIIFPDKVKMNLQYYYHRSFWGDILILWACAFNRKA